MNSKWYLMLLLLLVPILVIANSKLAIDNVVSDETYQLDAVAGKDVMWRRHIVFTDKVDAANIDLPKSSLSFNVTKVVSGAETEVDSKSISDSGIVNDARKIEVNQQLDEIIIEYTTPAPTVSIKPVGKAYLVTVSSDIHYTSVETEISIPEGVDMQVFKRVGDKRYVVPSKLVDTNRNGKADKIRWKTPHLSSEEFEVNLTILNVKSHPAVGGNWVVEFNTAGTADLSIDAYASTTWVDEGGAPPTDLEFLSVACDGVEQPYVWNASDYVVLENYNCDGLTSSESSAVLTYGGHHLRFIFGDVVAFAHNSATEDAVNWNKTFTNGANYDIIEDIAIDSDGNVYATGRVFDIAGDLTSYGWLTKKWSSAGVEDLVNWNKSYSNGVNSDGAYSVVVDSNDHIYVGGYSTDIVADGTGGDWLIKKYYQNGTEFVGAGSNWNKTFDSGNNYDVINYMAVDSNDNLYVAGYSLDITGDGHSYDWLIKKYSSDGVEDVANWNKTFDGASNYDAPQVIAIDSADNVYVGGISRDVVGVGTSNDWLVKKWSSAGVEDTANWNKTFDSGNNADSVFALETDSEDNVYVGGICIDITGDGNGYDWLIKKYYSNGTEFIGAGSNWNKTFTNGANSDELHVLLVDDSDNIYAFGMSMDITGDGNGYGWIIKKYSSAGVEDTVNWNITYGNGLGNNCYGYGLTNDSNGDIFAGGGATDVTASGQQMDWMLKKYLQPAPTNPWTNNFSTVNDTSTATTGDTITWDALIEDGTELDWYMFRTNDSGAWINDTHWFDATAYSGDGGVTANITFNYTIAAAGGTYICGEFYFNNTGNSWNHTGSYAFNSSNCFTVYTVASIEFGYPEANKTYTHTTHIPLEVDFSAGAWANCEYTLTWYGDPSVHGDFYYPAHTYNSVSTPCGYDTDFDVDFDGKYTVEYCGVPGQNPQNCSEVNFYVDRKEVDGSRFFGAFIFPIGILGVSGILFSFGKKFNEEYSTMSLLFVASGVLLIPFSISVAYNVLQEYMKSPAVISTYETLFMVLVWGVIITSAGYALLKTTVYIIQKILARRRRVRGEPNV